MYAHLCIYSNMCGACLCACIGVVLPQLPSVGLYKCFLCKSSVYQGAGPNNLSLSLGISPPILFYYFGLHWKYNYWNITVQLYVLSLLFFSAQDISLISLLSHLYLITLLFLIPLCFSHNIFLRLLDRLYYLSLFTLC